MYTAENMNPVPLSTTTDYPVTPTTLGSDFGTMLMLLQLLFRTKKFDQQPEQKLEMKTNISWTQNNFTTFGQPNAKESKTTHEEYKDVSKIIKKREIYESMSADKNFLHERQAGEHDKEYQKQNSDLKFQNEQQDEERQRYKKEIRGMTDEEDEYCNSIDGLHLLPTLHEAPHSQFVKLTEHFGPGSKIVVRGMAKDNVPKMSFDFEYGDIIPLHIDNRWHYEASDNQLIFNTYNNRWGTEVVSKPAQINPDAHFVLSVICLQKEFKICINDAYFATYTHRTSPLKINQFRITNAADISSIYYHGSG